MKHLFSRNNSNDDGYSPWMGFTDLMSGLLIVFIVIGVVFLKRYNIERVRNEELQIENEELRKAKEEYERKYYEVMENNLKNLVSEYKLILEVAPDSPIKAEIDTVRGSIVLRRNGDAVFESGKCDIDNVFESYLDEYSDVFLRESIRIWKERNLKNIEIRIEGHTDPDSKTDWEDPFIGNLTLSMERAYAVYYKIYSAFPDSSEEREFMQKNMICVGYSYSRYLNENGNETNRYIYDKYRTIEFRIISK